MPLNILPSENSLSPESKQLIHRIPFFNNVYDESAEQYEKLMRLAEIIQASSGETIIRKGDVNMDAYFLLKGQLGVYLEESTDSEQVSTINPGNLFGIMSMITATSRSAYIICQPSCKTAVLVKLDFSLFADDSMESQLSLSTKLIFYRLAVHNIRWTLEINKMSDPGNFLSEAIRKLPLVAPEKDSKEELIALKLQARALSDILFEWNESILKQVHH